MSERKSGILLHISSLPSEFGIGDLGPCAYRFVDFLYSTKQSYWQILPVNPINPISAYSPYSSSSAFAGNVLFISPQLLVEDGILNNDDIAVKPNFSSTTVQYETARTYKDAVLNRAYERFISDPVVRQKCEGAFNDFISENALWVEDYALFVTIKNHFDGKIWLDWPSVLRNREDSALCDFAWQYKDEINKIKFLQYLFFRQWDRLKEYCKHRGVRLFGDMSIYMDLDSVDVWRHPQNYKLDDQLNPRVVAGVPPDYFSETGQRWGNPVYDWEVLKKSQFSWWIERFKFNFKLFDVVRVDHFRGLVQCWEIPAHEATAVNGQWIDVPTDDLFMMLKRCLSAPLPIIAEDLGYITEDVREVMRRFNFPGMKVLLFAFNGNMKDHPYLPHNYTDRCVVYTGTHDNNTVLGWFENEASDQEINNLKKYIKKKIVPKRIHWDFVQMALNSKAALAILPMQDILGLGSAARMNTPAVTGNKNWCWRVSSEDFSEALAEKLLNITLQTQRD